MRLLILVLTFLLLSLVAQSGFSQTAPKEFNLNGDLPLWRLVLQGELTDARLAEVSANVKSQNEALAKARKKFSSGWAVLLGAAAIPVSLNASLTITGGPAGPAIGLLVSGALSNADNRESLVSSRELKYYKRIAEAGRNLDGSTSQSLKLGFLMWNELSENTQTRDLSKFLGHITEAVLDYRTGRLASLTTDKGYSLKAGYLQKADIVQAVLVGFSSTDTEFKSQLFLIHVDLDINAGAALPGEGSLQ